MSIIYKDGTYYGVGGSSTEYTAGNGINIDENDEISIDEMPSADMSQIVDVVPPVPSDSGIKQERNMIWLAGKPFCALGSISIYVNPQTGVDNYSAGYGFSAAKPFASIKYAMNYVPKQSLVNTNSGESFIVSLHLSGSFTSTSIQTAVFESMSIRFYIVVDSDTIFTNYIFRFLNCSYAILRLNGNLTFNITNTSINSVVRVVNCNQTCLIIDSQNATAQDNKKLTINGNSTARNYIRGIEAAGGSRAYSSSSYIITEFNYCDSAIMTNNSTMGYFLKVQGANNNTVYNSTGGSVLAYGNNSATGTNLTKTSYGGRIYTATQ